MNLLLLEPKEGTGPSVFLRGRRAEHLLAILKVAVGDNLRVGIINGPIGSARVVAIQPDQVEITLFWPEEKEEKTKKSPLSQAPHIDLILALPRPIMLQRILRQATVLGVRHFHLIRTRRVEKSFFHSPLLQPEKSRVLLLEGLEQAMDTRLPGLSIYPQFRPFIEDALPQLSGQGLIAHPGLEHRLADLSLFAAPPEQHLQVQKNQKILLAVGPEGGFSDYELQAFLDQGFSGFTMGPRILHVDTAVVSLLAQLQLLYDLRDRRQR